MHQPTVNVIYARKSSESEDRQVLSIQSQIEELRRAASSRGLRIDHVFEESQSAKSPGRPVFNKLLAEVRKRRIGAILCWKADRLARNVLDGAALIHALDQGDLREIVTANGTTFTGRPEEKFMLNIEFGLSAKFIDDLRSNVNRGMKKKREMGWHTGMAPLGYLNDLRTRTIVRDPDRFESVRRMWDMALAGIPLATIAETANASWGLRTPLRARSGDGPIRTTYLYKMFANRFYTGVFKVKDAYFDGLHEAMVTTDEFDAVQERVSRKTKARPTKHDFALAGLMRCGECGSAIVGSSHVRKSHTFNYYHCTKRMPCGQRHVRAEDVEAQFVDHFGTLRVPDELVAFARAYLDGLAEEIRAEAQQADQRRAREVEKVERQRQVLTQMRLREAINDEEYEQERSRLVLESAKLRDARKTTSRTPSTPRGIEPTMEVLSLLNSAKSTFADGTSLEKRLLVGSVCSNCALHDGKVVITAKKPYSVFSDQARFSSWQALVEAVRTEVSQDMTTSNGGT